MILTFKIIVITRNDSKLYYFTIDKEDNLDIELSLFANSSFSFSVNSNKSWKVLTFAVVPFGLVKTWLELEIEYPMRSQADLRDQ